MQFNNWYIKSSSSPMVSPAGGETGDGDANKNQVEKGW